jgi:hypothetical protein
MTLWKIKCPVSGELAQHHSYRFQGQSDNVTQTAVDLFDKDAASPL